jgi:hypothetical protein
MLLGFRVDDSAARGGRLQTLGLGSARVAAALVALGRALVQLGVPAVGGDLAVGGLVPLRPAWASRSDGSGAPPSTSRATSTTSRSDDLAALRNRWNAACASKPSRSIKTPSACSMSNRCSKAACSWSASRPLTCAVTAAASKLATRPA